MAQAALLPLLLLVDGPGDLWLAYLVTGAEAALTVFVTGLIHGGDAQAGLLRGVQAVGGFAGTATAGPLPRRLGAPRLLTVGVLVFGAVSALTWNLSVTSLGLGTYLALFTAAGVPAVWLAAAWLSLVQESAPLAVRGRVMASVLAAGLLTLKLLPGAGPVQLSRRARGSRETRSPLLGGSRR